MIINMMIFHHLRRQIRAIQELSHAWRVTLLTFDEILQKDGSNCKATFNDKIRWSLFVYWFNYLVIIIWVTNCMMKLEDEEEKIKSWTSASALQGDNWLASINKDHNEYWIKEYHVHLCFKRSKCLGKRTNRRDSRFRSPHWLWGRVITCRQKWQSREKDMRIGWRLVGPRNRRSAFHWREIVRASKPPRQRVRSLNDHSMNEYERWKQSDS